MNTKPIFEVLLPLPFDHGFSYFAPDFLQLEIGDVVKVPFGKKEIHGVVLEVNSSSNLDVKKIKTIISKDPILKIDWQLLEFIKWVASYNLSPLGAVLKLCISILGSIKNVAKIKKKIPDYQIHIDNFKLKLLSADQKKSAEFLEKKISENKHSVTLIDGVTGSGKTEIYFAAIAKVLQEQDGQVLILLPEIVLTTQLINRFSEQFGFRPPIWHSKISPSKKKDIFYALADGQIRILVGARSALFLPFKKLSLIVIDEEHEASFKQDDTVNYNGRDMAIVRAKIEKIPVILSSATPSLESYINAKNEKYHHLILDQKFSSNLSTKINLVDMKKEKLAKNNFLSEALKNELQKNLIAKKQSLLFLNRRGYASLTLCKICGHKINCHHCSSYLTYHQKLHKFICHHCGYSSKGSDNCPSCHEKNCLISCGVGVEKIKEEVVKHFPEAKIALITSDSVTNLNEAENIIKQILDNEIDIIIGTQMIAKGHHFPSLALVGIVDGDASFYNGDLRNAERSYQLLTQLIGRAGRDKYQGQVILQTYNIDNLIFKYVSESSKNKFLELEIKNREIMNMPPFSKMVALIFSSAKEKYAIEMAKLILREFPHQQNIEIFGPAPMPIYRVRGKYYQRLIVKFDKKINIQKLIRQILAKVVITSSVRVKIDVDPL